MPGIETAPIPVAFAPPLPRLGLILLATDLTTERDVARMIPPDRAGMHGTRLAFVNPTTPENLRRMLAPLSAAADLIVPGVPLAAICFGCTSASAVLGEEAVRDAIGAARPGVPVITPTGAAGRSLAALGARRIAILTPYLAETTAPVVTYFEARGFEVVRAICLGLDDDRRMAAIDDETIVAAAQAADHPTAEALFISCTALPVLPLVPRIEALIGKPVVTSNQAAIGEMLAAAGLDASVVAPGRSLISKVPA